MNAESSAPWWRHAVVYQVYPRSFSDANGDGIGDLPGITSRLTHLRDLGVDALWISPFYTSPQHDHGYDVADYRDIDPLFGTLADADELIARSHQLGLRVIVDLVPNHTSDQHDWFQAALAAAPGSPERARYVFRDGRGPNGEEPPNNWSSVFGGPAWERVPDGQWYLHLFDRTQPDLDWRNPEVGDMFEDVLRFWLDRGVDGFRVDVAHGLLKEESLRDQILAEGEEPTSGASAGESMMGGLPRDEPMWDQPEVHDVYRRWRRVLSEYDGDRMLVAEAWTQTAASLARYVRPDEMHQAFNFAWLLAPWSAEAFAGVVTSTLQALDDAAPTWVLSNHDVVRHVTRYGGGPVGLARARAATVTMLALPGSAYLYQGEELGLEEVDVAPEHRQDPAWVRTGRSSRDGCRVPIPWSGDRPPYGFGPGTGQPWLPQPSDWARRTVAAEDGVAGSTLELYREALAARRKLAAAEPDAVELLDLGAEVLAFRRGALTVVLNCGEAPVPMPAGEVVLASGPVADTLPADTAVWLR
ncbi:glycoside hydrolase family 13 protein [Nocardioides sp.]|uniref:glycoside hydrolase family 13 protein n=1 Tax=Nocardioides sp. TaxID=35761 RepID=UPI0039E423FB